MGPPQPKRCFEASVAKRGLFETASAPAGICKLVWRRSYRPQRAVGVKLAAGARGSRPLLSTLAASAALIFELEKPSGLGLFPGVVLVHHLPGWSEFYIETTRRFAHHGYLAICANLYERAGQGDPDDVAAKVRADGGIADAQVVGDTDAAVKWMRTQTNHNGKIGVFGSCSGGRHAVIYACQRKDVDACADLWGGRVVMGKE